tara:strand:+ start:255 stop:389 length:135 start_codon:yes stop_codon:yes gene_type:complete
MLNKIEPLVYLSFFAYITMLEGHTFISTFLIIVILIRIKLEFYE